MDFLLQGVHGYVKIRELIRDFEMKTRPIQPESRAALQKRWNELPEGVKTDNQILGRFAVGCEGTHAVFPKCNLTCSPCYHSADANKVRVNGEHTLNSVKEQMAYFRKVRGPRAHAQLIGGEVSLLSPNDHAAALLAMRANGREPMSFTHGDFDYTYLKNLALDANGIPRFLKLSFAAHFDSLMRGRRGMVSPKKEAELNPFRENFAAMFIRLKREHGVRSYLAHNMTVTPSNSDQVSEVASAVVAMPFNMLSFQPAAFVGDRRRWHENFEEVTIDGVWSEIEKGVGHALPWKAIQFGDPRCNRSTVVIRINGRIVPLLNPEDQRDIHIRDLFLNHFGGMIFGNVPIHFLMLKITRVLLRNPGDFLPFLFFVNRLVREGGGIFRVIHAVVKRNLEFKTFVVHNFMDAAVVGPAWELMEKGVISDDPKLKETQERLMACSYAMSHPETGRLVPACVQHSVLDPRENSELKRLLPIFAKTPTSF